MLFVEPIKHCTKAYSYEYLSSRIIIVAYVQWTLRKLFVDNSNAHVLDLIQYPEPGFMHNWIAKMPILQEWPWSFQKLGV